MERSLGIIVLIQLVMIMVVGCYLPISGRIVDAETNNPIEGAVVLVEWTKTKGIGLTYAESCKVAEMMTGKDGKFIVPGVFAMSVNSPDLTIYKQGYVAWNNKRIYPKNNKRADFEWRNKAIVKLEKIKEPFHYYEHYSFIMSVARPESALGKKKLFFDAYNQSERKKAVLDMGEQYNGGKNK